MLPLGDACSRYRRDMPIKHYKFDLGDRLYAPYQNMPAAPPGSHHAERRAIGGLGSPGLVSDDLPTRARRRSRWVKVETEQLY
jgi:hypothetical protein